MANPEHLALVRKGAEAIAKWRAANPTGRLELRDAKLAGAKLSGASLAGADLSRANLSRANLSRADLINANLGAADLNGANLSRANMFEADLTKASFSRANLFEARLGRANLTDADLSGANLGEASLGGANLNTAFLGGTNLQSARLDGASMWGAMLGDTSLGSVDLSKVDGLATVVHVYPSSIGVDTLVASVRGAGDNLPQILTFFRGAGVPEELLKEVPRIVATVKHDSCFISYGQPDLAFATKLYEDLKARGLSSWLYEMDKKVGERTWEEIGTKRREADRMVLICSARALVRDGVRKEIEQQIDEEPDKLMPISLDDLWREKGFMVVRGESDLKPFLMNRNYADFAGWDSDAKRYEKGLQALLRGLEREKQPE